MTRLLARLGSLFSLFTGLCLMLGLTACMDREGPAPEPESIRKFVDPVPDGEEQLKVIVEPFIGNRVNAAGSVVNSQSLSLFSLDTDLDPALDRDTDPVTEILASLMSNDRRGIVQALDTAHDARAEPEYSVVVRNDSLYSVDHRNGTYRGLVNFAETVCELKPKKIVDATVNGMAVTYRVLHDTAVYVMTSEGSGTVSDCTNPDLKKRYYLLTLNFRFDAYDNDPDFSNDLISVSEAEYNAELVFGWNDVEVSESDPNQELDFGFLGYDSTARELVFFDRDRQREWSQQRRLERFSAPAVDEVYLHRTWFRVQNLPHYQVMVQLGRDVFIVDAGQAFFNPAPSEIRTILSDRVYQKTAETGGTYARELTVAYNNEDVLILDKDRLYQYTYAPSSVPPSAYTYTIHDLPDAGHGVDSPASKHVFTQFDLRPCRAPFFTDIEECELANSHQESDLASWQFVTACTADNGCTLPVDTTDYCTTQAEFILTQDSRNLCTVLHYAHLNELNDSSNDATFLGFLPYVAEYARAVELQMDAESVFITARMNERDFLLRYFYKVPLTAPKPSREQILLGQRIAHVGLDVYLKEDNLFVTALNNLDDNIRSQCYSGYVQIDCDDCPQGGEEWFNGECVRQFYKYRSMALFCSAQKLADGICTDNQIIPFNTLAVHDGDRDGKWLEELDISAGDVVERTMSLLVSDEVSDEGVLSSPAIVSVDNQTGAAETNVELGRIAGPVESVLGRWNLDDRISRVNLIRQDIAATAPLFANTGVFFLDNEDQSYPDALEAGQLNFRRKLDVIEFEADTEPE